MVTSLAQLSERGAGRFPGVVVALTLAFLYGPVLVVGYLSLSPTAQPTIPLDALSVRWYGEIAQSTRFVRALVNSLVIGVAAAVGGTGLGLAGAYTITRSRLSATVRRGLALVIALPLFVPTVVVAFGIGRASAIAGLGFGYLPVILGHLFWVLPFTTFLLAARYAELDDALSAAAADLGANRQTVFRTVTLPLLRPALTASALFAFALSFNEFLITFFLAGSAVTTVPLEIFGKVRIGATAFLNAASVVVLLISAVAAGAASALRKPV
ncbi:ABC transporter permease [Halobacteriales archaeon QH_7_66_36]|jgi:spermidine/putrescine transport system permease protein|nr:MAG: ABC transporter permease [Halobacteriales archaeon QH_7_66_36]